MSVTPFDPRKVRVTWGGVELHGFDAAFAELRPAPSEPCAIVRDEQSECELAQARARVAEVRAAMERLAVGCTYDAPCDGPSRFHYRKGPGDRWARYVAVAGSLGGRSPIRYDVCEGAWLPEEGPISDGAGSLPADEPADEVARRLLGLAPRALFGGGS